MELPSIKFIVSLAIVNMLILTIGASMATFFGTDDPTESVFDTDAFGDPTALPDMNVSSIIGFKDSISSIIDWLIDNVNLIFNMMTLNFPGMPTALRLMIIIPLAIMNMYVAFLFILKIAEIIIPG